MGLFDKLNLDKLKQSFEEGTKALENLAESGAKALNELAESAGLNTGTDGAKPEAAAPAAQPAAQPPRPAAAAAGESGDSWGEEMPAEENQFNFSGNYVEYFSKILREDFAEYRVETDASDMCRRTVFTLYSGLGKALVIEVMTEGSGARKIRNACEKEGTPYVRFYYDHDGWWNTRTYVTRRIRAALR